MTEPTNPTAIDQVVASGGAGGIQDFVTLFQTLPKVDAGLAASIFHFGEVSVAEANRAMAQARIPVRELA